MAATVIRMQIRNGPISRFIQHILSNVRTKCGAFITKWTIGQLCRPTTLSKRCQDFHQRNPGPVSDRNPGNTVQVQWLHWSSVPGFGCIVPNSHLAYSAVCLLRSVCLLTRITLIWKLKEYHMQSWNTLEMSYFHPGRRTDPKMSVFPAACQFSPGCDRVMAAVQWTGSTLTGLPVQSTSLGACFTGFIGIIGTYGVHLSIGRIGISNGVSGHAKVCSLAWVWIHSLKRGIAC